MNTIKVVSMMIEQEDEAYIFNTVFRAMLTNEKIGPIILNGPNCSGLHFIQ